MEYSPPFNFYAPLWESQLSEIDAQHDDGTGNHPVASDLQLAIVINPATPVCCGKACGTYVPLVVNGIYHDPNGGINHITFNLSTSPSCGIPVARVFGGNLEGLIGRDDIVVLNPKSNSIRLRIEVSHPSLVGPSHRLTCAKSCRATRCFSPRSAQKSDTVYTVSARLTINQNR